MVEPDPKVILEKAKAKKAIKEAELAEKKLQAFDHQYVEISMVKECLKDLQIIVCPNCRKKIDQIIDNVEKVTQKEG